jgi:hypothetical protein
MLLGVVLAVATPCIAQQVPGSIRGLVNDKEFDVPIQGAIVTIVETGQRVTTTDGGHYVFKSVTPGRYTLAFSKDGYLRIVKADVAVSAAQLAEIDVALAGEFNDLEEVVVQDLAQEAAGSESALFKMRFESPALMDSIGAELISRAGAGDAAGALRLVSGATVQDGKTAVIRGLPDRYVSSQLNGVRLPTADENKRAVELDQFPASVIESVQVAKTFTPDQQGDASGGAVNVKLRGIPSDPLFVRFSAQTSFNTQAAGSDFLTYEGGGFSFLGSDDGGRDIQYSNIGSSWDGAVGVMRGDAPIDSKWSLTAGGKLALDGGWKVGGLLNLFYERDSAFYDNGKKDSYWVQSPGAPMTPAYNQGDPQQGTFKTELFDVTQGKQSVQNGALVVLGAEKDGHEFQLSFLTTHAAEDTATLAEDTRGKQYFFPGYDPTDPSSPGFEQPDAAPYLRLETLDFVERITRMLALSGSHALENDEFDIGEWRFGRAEIDWTLSTSMASSNNPDKRQFGTLWTPGFEVFPGFNIPPLHQPYTPAENINLGNLQRIWKEIDEQSNQISVNVKLPFATSDGSTGYVKAGLFSDRVTRSFEQNSYTNRPDPSNPSIPTSYSGPFGQYWSSVFGSENHPIAESFYDVDYKGELDVSALYLMADVPMGAEFKWIGGARLESTALGVKNSPDVDPTTGVTPVVWYPLNAQGTPIPTVLTAGAADAEFDRMDLLPSLGFEWKFEKDFTLRGSYNHTIARQTFKELTPIQQQEYLGGPIFIGNPSLGMSSLRNYDLRVDWAPYEGGLASASVFHKSITDPIEYVQKIGLFNYTTAVNYPEGELTGIEVEVRHDLSREWDALAGFSAGANATLIKSSVTLPDEEAALFNGVNIQAPMTSRDMTNAPSSLLNLFLTYDNRETKTQAALFYTLQGDALLAGATVEEPYFVPSVYSKSFGTLNFSFLQEIAEGIKIQFQAKNLLNPDIRTVYRSDYIISDVTRTSYTKGIDLSLALSAEIHF